MPHAGIQAHHFVVILVLDSSCPEPVVAVSHDDFEGCTFAAAPIAGSLPPQQACQREDYHQEQEQGGLLADFHIPQTSVAIFLA